MMSSRFDESGLPGAASGKIDAAVPHSARIWNYWLGGKDHYDVDRKVGDEIAEVFPGIGDLVRADRAFLARAVRYLAGEAGIRQFLDIGIGLPTVDNAHEVAQRVAPQSRVVYVDNDPLVLAHARALLTGTPEGATSCIDADLHDPDKILTVAAETLDFREPVAVMMLGVLDFVIDDEEARKIVEVLVSATPPGSHLAIAHSTTAVGGEQTAAAIRHWNSFGKPSMTPRTPEEIEAFFVGLEVLEPGVVSCSRWRAEHSPFGEPAQVDQFCGVGRRP